MRAGFISIWGILNSRPPECSGLCDMVAFDKAGERTFQAALRQLGLNGEATFFKNNIDHFTGATFGCHENYLIRRNVPFSTLVIPALLPFLATRQIFSGAGRVGSYDDSFFYYSRDDQNEQERSGSDLFSDLAEGRPHRHGDLSMDPILQGDYQYP